MGVSACLLACRTTTLLIGARATSPDFRNSTPVSGILPPRGAGKSLKSWGTARSQQRQRLAVPTKHLAKRPRALEACGVMFLRHKLRRKDGKEHRYWSIVENRRVSGGRTVQRHVLYLGEINDSQRAAWCQTIEAFDEGGRQARQIALFPEDRVAPALDCDVVHVRLNGLRLRRPRQWGACWLACDVWDQLRLDDFWLPRLPASRQGTRWLC